jgi:Spy/CpxP family protein refolding chaperone
MEDEMSYRWPVVLMLGTMMTLPLMAVHADESGMPPASDSETHHWMRGKHHDKDGLTDDQKSKLKTIKESQEKALKPLWRKQRDLTIKLHDQLEDKASDAEISRTLTDLKANRESMRTEAMRFMSQKEAILTPTQQAHMFLMHQFKGEEGGRWEHERMGHRDESWKEDEHDGHHEGHGDHDGDGHDDGGMNN